MTEKLETDLPIGSIVVDDYEVQQKIGQGSFGTVHLVRSRRTGEQFAVKCSHALGDQARKDLLVELQSWVNMPAHPNVVGCRFYRSLNDRILIFADYVEGGSLREWLNANRVNDLPEQQRLEVICSIAANAAWGLEAAHRNGIVHQDVKPSNILLASDLTAKITDLGLASQRTTPAETEMVLDYLLQDLGESAPLEKVKGLLRKEIGSSTEDTNAIPGSGKFTLEYASPEQLKGKSVSSKSDIWSWGLCVLEMFNGRATWPSGDVAIEALQDIFEAGPAQSDIPRMPSSIRDVLVKCFADIDHRWPSIGEASQAFVEAFEATTDSKLSLVRPDLAESSLQTHDRRLRSGADWRDPRIWLAFVTRESGRDPSEAQAHWPTREGTRKTQAIADLRAFEHAESILKSLVDNGRADLLHDHGCMLGEIAMIQSSLGDVKGSHASYCRCNERLLQANTLTARRSLVVAFNGMSIMLRQAGRTDDALAAAQETIEMAENLYEETGEDEDRILIALASGTKGNVVGSPHETFELHSKAAKIYEATSDEAGLAKSLASLAPLLLRDGQPAEAEKAATRSEEIIRRLINDERRFDLKHVLAQALLNRAVFTEYSYRPSQSLPLITEAFEIYRELVDAGHWELQGELGSASFHRGITEEAMGNINESMRWYARAREAFTEAVNREGISTYADELAESFDHEATLRRNYGDLQTAIQLDRDAVELWQRLNEIEDDRYEKQLAHAQVGLAVSLAISGNTDQGLKMLQDASQALQKLQDRKGLASAWMEQGIIYRKLGEAQKSADAYSNAIDTIVNAEGIDSRNLEAHIYQNFGNLLGEGGQEKLAIHYVDQAIGIWQTHAEKFGPETVAVDIATAEKAKSNHFAKLGAWEQSVEVGQRAIAKLQTLVEGGRPDLQTELGMLLLACGSQQLKLGWLEEARQTLARGAEAYGHASDAQPADAPNLQSFVDGQFSQIDKLLAMQASDVPRCLAEVKELVSKAQEIGQAGNMDVACQFYDDALVILRRAAEISGDDPELLKQLADLGLRRGVSFMYVGKTCASEDGFHMATSLLDRLIQSGHSECVGEWARAMLGLASFLAHDQRPDDAKQVAETLKTRIRAEGSPEDQQWCEAVDHALQQMQNLD